MSADPRLLGEDWWKRPLPKATHQEGMRQREIFLEIRTRDIVLSNGAFDDLRLLTNQLHNHESQAAAVAFLERVRRLLTKRSGLKIYGRTPHELAELDNEGQYREVVIRPYRIIFRAVGQQLLVDLVVHQDADLLDILTRRLLNQAIEFDQPNSTPPNGGHAA